MWYQSVSSSSLFSFGICRVSSNIALSPIQYFSVDITTRRIFIRQKLLSVGSLLNDTMRLDSRFWQKKKSATGSGNFFSVAYTFTSSQLLASTCSLTLHTFHQFYTETIIRYRRCSIDIPLCSTTFLGCQYLRQCTILLLAFD